MNTPGSSKINILDFRVLYDLSSGTPTIVVTNMSSGPDLTTCKWWFEVTTPSNSLIHQGSLGTPDKTGTWTTWTIPEAWPQRFGHVEWSGEPYTVTLYVNDGAVSPLQFDLAYNAELCPPAGNGGNAKFNFGVGKIATPNVKCDSAQVLLEDITNYLYKGITGTPVSLDWMLVFPNLPSGSSLSNETISGTSYALFTVPYNANGYIATLNVVRDYVIDANTTVRIKYKSTAYFDVKCDIDLCSIICGYQKLLNDATGDCPDASVKNKLNLLNAKVNMAIVASSNKCTGIDLSSLIAEIKKMLGDYDCGCSDGNGISASGLN